MAAILFLCSRPPFPPNDGARVRMFNLAKALARSHDVDVVALSRDVEYEDPGDQFRSYRVFDEHPWRSYLRGVRSLVSREPIQCRTHLSPRMKEWVDDNVHEYDLVYCTHLATVKYVEGYDVPKVVDFVDAVSKSFREFARHASLPWALVYRIESRRARNFERTVAERFDRCFITSEIDRDHIGRDSIEVVPNGVDDALLEYDVRVPDNHDLVFVGDLRYLPNQTAVEWFVTEILPAVRKDVDDATLTVVGKSPPDRIERFDERDGVDVTGFVEDPYEYLHDSRLSVAPIRIGGGIQNKVLESLAIGTPVVTTGFGAGGIEADDGRHLLVRNDESEFASAVVDLLEDGERARRLARNGRELVERNYTWDGVRPLIDGHVRSVLEEPRRLIPTQQ